MVGVEGGEGDGEASSGVAHRDRERIEERWGREGRGSGSGVRVFPPCSSLEKEERRNLVGGN